MRNAFIEKLSEYAAQDPRVFLITGDLGFAVLDDFKRRFPKQFLNVGVAEQNMTAVGTGLALSGFTVFTYSIGNFPTLRCLEQLRNDAFYHEANVNVVSVGGGFSYGQLGMSHHATEDLSIMRSLPCVTVIAPGSRFETREAVSAQLRLTGPTYLRLERAAANFVDDGSVPFEVGKARELRSGNDLTLVASGGVVSEAVSAADKLKERGVQCRVLSMPTLKPFDAAAMRSAAMETGGIISIEENSVLGGLGGAVAEVCLESDIRPKFFRRLGIADTYVSVVGDQSFLRKSARIDQQSIIQCVLDILGL